MSEQQGEGTHIPGEENLSAQGAVLSTEERAAAVGWHEKDGGLSAEDFIAKRDDHNGLLRNDVKKLEAKIAESNATMNSMAEFLQKNRADALKQGYDKAIADAAAEMQQAVDDSDGDAFTRAAQKKDQLTERKDKVDEETIIQAPAAQANPLQVAFSEHRAAHPEMFDTSVKAQLWEQELRYQGSNNPNMSFEDAAAAADKVVRETHFQQRSHLGPVDGETSSGKVSALSEIPGGKEALAQFQKSNPNFTAEEYVRIYNEAES